jgi:hypothetical protein
VSVTAIANIAAIVLVGGVVNVLGDNVARVPENVLWTIVKTIVTPQCQRSAEGRDDTGVAVSELNIGVNGDVLAVNVLDSPGPTIASCLASTLSKWKFEPQVSAKDSLQRIGKITYYFVFKEGHLQAVPSNNAPYVGPSSGRGSANREKSPAVTQKPARQQ